MIKKIIKIFSFFIFIFIIFYKNNVHAFSMLETVYSIESYDINVIVNENNIFDITETINVNFYEPTKTFYKDILTKYKINRIDGTEFENRPQITELIVNDNYDIVDEKNGVKRIVIGNTEKYYNGECTFVIKYKYNIGKDPLKKSDELCFKLLENTWDNKKVVRNLSFTIKMPKEFDSSSLVFLSGYDKLEMDTDKVEYTVSGNEITGKLKENLSEYQSLIVNLSLPEGYFVGDTEKNDMYSISVIAVSIVFLVCAYIYWKKYGKDKIKIETVEFYPIEGCNSAQARFYYTGKVDKKGAISLLFYLASKGYLRIKSDGNKNFFIKKLKEYDGNNEYERIFFDGLFSKTSNDYVTSDNLFGELRYTISSINSRLKKNERKKIFDNIVMNKKNIIIMMMIVILFVFMISKPFFEDGIGVVGIVMGIIFALIYTLIMPILEYVQSKIAKILAIGYTLLLSTGVCTLWLYSEFVQNSTFLTMYIITSISIGILIYILSLMPRRTAYGIEVLGKLEGYRNFLMISEKEELERLVEKNPDQFMNILPYTYALDVSDKWVKQFEIISYEIGETI